MTAAGASPTARPLAESPRRQRFLADGRCPLLQRQCTNHGWKLTDLFFRSDTPQRGHAFVLGDSLHDAVKISELSSQQQDPLARLGCLNEDLDDDS